MIEIYFPPRWSLARRVQWCARRGWILGAMVHHFSKCTHLEVTMEETRP